MRGFGGKEVTSSNGEQRYIPKEQEPDIEKLLFASVGIWVIGVIIAYDCFLAELCLFLQCSVEQTLQSYENNANEDGWRYLVFWKKRQAHS